MEGDPQVPLDDSPAAVAARHRKTWLTLGGVVLLVAILIALYAFLSRPPPAPGAGETLSQKQVADVMAPLTARLESIGVMGQPQFVGLAVTVAQGEMVTTCHGLPRGGTALRVVFRDGESRAESARVNRALNMCVLKVSTTGPSAAKLRVGEPANGEKVYVATVTDTKNPPKLVETRVANLVMDPNGAAMKLEAKQDFPSGAPVFDSQGRLVGIVVFPHSYGDFTAALSISRLAAARKP